MVIRTQVAEEMQGQECGAVTSKGGSGWQRCGSTRWPPHQAHTHMCMRLCTSRVTRKKLPFILRSKFFASLAAYCPAASSLQCTRVSFHAAALLAVSAGAHSYTLLVLPLQSRAAPLACLHADGACNRAELLGVCVCVCVRARARARVCVGAPARGGVCGRQRRAMTHCPLYSTGAAHRRLKRRQKQAVAVLPPPACVQPPCTAAPD